MRKFKYLFLLIVVLFLTGCKIPEEEKPFNPDDVEVKIKSSGSLFQLDDQVGQVTFSIEHNQTKYAPKKVIWNRNLIDIFEGETFEFTPTKNLISKTDIYAKVVFEGEDNEEHEFKTDVLTVRVNGRSAEIEISASDSNLDKTVIDLLVSGASQTLNIDASVSGDYGVSDLTWWLINEENNLATEITTHAGKASASYDFSTAGLFRIEARILGDKFVSNKIYVDAHYERIMATQSKKADGSTLISTSLEGAESGTFKWEKMLVNGSGFEEIIGETESSLTIPANAEIGFDTYRVTYTNNDQTRVTTSEPVLVINNSREVRTEAEFLQALNEKVKVIEFKNNIDYTKIDGPGSVKHPIVIDYPLTIIGNNYSLTSLGIFVFIEVNSSNVWFKDIKINHSSRYNVVVNRSKNVYFDNVEFIKPGGGSDMMTPGAGIYAHGSDVTVKNITITEGYNSGLRVEAYYEGDVVTHKGNITILGKYRYNVKELAAPIIAVRSKSSDANITAVGFDEFVIPIGNGKMIRRWSNDAYGVKWQLREPYNVEYTPGAEIDFSGIVINVRIGAGETTNFGLEFVYLFLDMFKETGTIRMTKPGEIDNKIKEYTIYAYDKSTGGDFLLYKDEQGNQTKAFLPQESGDYQVHIWVGDTAEGEGLYLGYIVVRVGASQ